MGLIQKLFGTYSDRELKKINTIVDKIEALDAEDDWNAAKSYKVVQDNPDNTHRCLVYPQDVIGVWLDAPMPESSDEYDYGY